MALQANSTDIVGFAEHWGNFGLRQYVPAYVLPESVYTVEMRRTVGLCPAWYGLKVLSGVCLPVHSVDVGLLVRPPRVGTPKRR